MSEMIYDYELVVFISDRRPYGAEHGTIPNYEGHNYVRASLGTLRQKNFAWFIGRGFWCDPDPLSYQPWFKKNVGLDEVCNYIVDKEHEGSVISFLSSFSQLDTNDFLIQIEAYVNSFQGWRGRISIYDRTRKLPCASKNIIFELQSIEPLCHDSEHGYQAL